MYLGGRVQRCRGLLQKVARDRNKTKYVPEETTPCETTGPAYFLPEYIFLFLVFPLCIYSFIMVYACVHLYSLSSPLHPALEFPTTLYHPLESKSSAIFPPLPSVIKLLLLAELRETG